MKKLILFLLVPVMAFGQRPYHAEAPLSNVVADGFYSIPLPPNITASLWPDERNIRILDSQDVEVPYIFQYDNRELSTFEWIPMKIEKELKKDCCTIVTIINENHDLLDNFLLQVKNAEINKTATLRGSDDGEIWYAVAEKIRMTFGKLKTDEVSEVFDFPLSNYKYYRLTINDSTTTPVNVVGALRTREDIIHGSFTEIPDVIITSVDSTQNRATWGIIEFDTAQYVDRIEFDVSGPHLFKRRATLFSKVDNRLHPLVSFDIISGQARALMIGLKEKQLFIRVDNENNPPLKFTQVAAYQYKRTLIAYLEKGHDYRIAISNEYDMPSYDLKFFKDSIPAHPSELKIGALKEQSMPKEEEMSPTFFTNRQYIWIAIILVGIVLAAMTMRMLRDKDFNNR